MHDSEQRGHEAAGGQAGVNVVWRSLDDRHRTAAAREQVQRDLVRPLPEGTSRRAFLQVMGVSAAAAGLAGCARQPIEKIIPYVKQPEELVPGRPLFFATALTVGGVASPVLVESHSGRPTKIEGNPEHPASLGATDRFAQAEIMHLYDPDRSTTLYHLDEIATWQGAADALRVALGEQQVRRGAGLRVLSPTLTSPTVERGIAAFLAAYPDARWVQYDCDSRDAEREGTRRIFGTPLAVRYDFTAADVVLALDADFLAAGPGSVRYARDFFRRRRVESGEHGASHATMNRLYVAETAPTSTGAIADHRLGLTPQELAIFAGALAAELGVPGAARPGAPLGPKAAAWVGAVARDLAAHRGRAAVVAGDAVPAEVHVLALAMNQALDAVGRTVLVTDPPETRPANQLAALSALAADMQAGTVDALVVLGANPVYDAPADLAFGDAMRRVKQCFHLGLYRDETAELCHWHVPALHELETWGDARAYDGTVTLQQPLLDPLYGGKSLHDLLAVLTNNLGGTAYDEVRATWQKQWGPDFESKWRRAVHDGFVAGTQFPAREVLLNGGAVQDAAARIAALAPSPGLEIAFRLDPAVHDGRFANNGWLQELPKPWTKLTWDNAAIVSPLLAQTLGVANGDRVELQTEAGRVEAGVWVLPGQPERCITAHLGYGRRRAGRFADGAGFDANRLRSSRMPWSAPLQAKKIGGERTLVTTQEHHDMIKRDLVRHATLAEFLAEPHFAHQGHEEPGPELSMYPPREYKGNAWGLAVDLSACTGCNACVMACNSENNIPVVGRDQVRRNREMHWIRIDRYFEGDPGDPQIHHQPVMCQQCENAPCEVVCPVAATSHSPEGLNDMVYNRCVGTKYCSNNCPYKVRRFNFYKYADVKTPVLKLMRNPDVTVRTRGVMEKCTYCVQRINHARIDAKNEGRPIRDGEVLTACQQVCPSEAIVFGNLNDPASKIAKIKSDPRNYAILGDLNTRPRTTYLAKLRNPNPELEAKA